MLSSLVLLAVGALAFALFLNSRRPARALLLFGPSWVAAWLTVELAGHLIVLNAIVAGVLVWLGALEHWPGIVGLVLLAISVLAGTGFLVASWRSSTQMRDALEDLAAAPEAPPYPRSHVFLPFLVLRRRGVRHERGVVYCERDGRPLKLDVYLPTEPPSSPRPAVVQVHGGGWFLGTRKEQGIPLLNHLAANGWVGFNIDYRLSPMHTLPAHVIDVKQAIAWVREQAVPYDVDPSFVALTGGSAGGHLTALAALTAGDRSLQPGFEEADTSVAAAVPFYGVYDFLDPELPGPVRWLLQNVVLQDRMRVRPELFRAMSPTHLASADAPPFLVIHGQADSIVPVGQARDFVAALRGATDNPVLYAEMEGGQHAFDVFPSLRTAPVVEGIERFLRAIRERRSVSDDELEPQFDAATA